MTEQQESAPRPEPFGRELRRIRTGRGLSLARVAELTHYSKGYLSKIETGAKPASADLARRLDELLDAGGHLVRLLAATNRRPPREPTCPYRGLAAFDGDDARWFFGREEATAEALDVVGRALATGRPAVLVGPSGVGKSSLLHAAMLPALARDAVEGSAGWPVLAMTPTADPGAELARRAELVPETSADRIILVVDQFEELFTLCAGEPDRAAFIRALAGIAATGRALVVLALRADFYDRCLRYPELLASFRGTQLTVGPMTEPQLRAAISRPAELAGLRLEPGLADVLLAEAEPSALPLLSHALLATWQEREGGVLTVAGYRRTGGIANAVAETAERAYAALPAQPRAATQAVLLSLVRVGEHEQDSRRPALRRQLPDPDGADDVVEALATARLLTVDADTVIIAHEALLHAWPRLHEWIESDRAGLRLREQLREAAEAWDGDGRHPSLLYRGPRLELVAGWAAGQPGRLGAMEQDFLTASQAQEDATRVATTRRTRRLRRLVAGLTVMTLVAVAATVFAIERGYATIRQRDVAVSRVLAGEANESRPTDPSLSAQLSLAAYRVADTPEARGSMLAASGYTPVRQMKGQPGSVTSITAAPDGHTVVTSGEDGSTRIWSVSPAGTLDAVATLPGPEQVTTFALGGKLLATTGESGRTSLWQLASPPSVVAALPDGPAVKSAAFNDGDTLLALGRADGTIALWTVADPAHPHALGTLTGHTGAVVSLAFHANLLASGGEDFTARLWDTTSHTGTILARRGAAVRSVAFGPAGRLAVGSDEHLLELWSVDGHPVRTAVLDKDTMDVHSIAFSADGRTVVATGDDQTVHLWDVATGASITTLHEPAPARGASFTDHDRLLVTGDDTGTLWLWHLPAPMLTGTAGVDSIAYRPRGDGLAIGGDDGTVELRSGDDVFRWNGGQGVVHRVAFSPDGDVLATAGDGTVRLWNVASRTLLSSFPTGDAAVYAIAFAPAGDLLAAGGDSRVIGLWSVEKPGAPRPVGRLTGHENAIRGLAFSPDGATLASGGDDYSARLWDVHRPSAITKLPWLANAINAVAFSPDGKLLATASDDHTVALWDVTTTSRPAKLTTFTAHADAVQAVAFSPDGHLLATAAIDHAARLWDIGDPRSPIQLANLTGHTDDVWTVAFSPDGRRLATGSADHSVRFWLTSPDDAVQLLCSTSGPELSPEQWAHYASGAPYRHLC